MQKKYKITLGGLGFLGLNWALWPNLKNRFDSLSSLSRFNWGGHLARIDNFNGIKQIKLDNEKNQKDQAKLDLSKNTVKSFSLNLDTSSENRKDFLKSNSQELGGPLTISNVSELHKEINKEGQLTAIGEKTFSKYDEPLKKHFPSKGEKGQVPFADFQKIKSQIQQWKNKRNRQTGTIESKSLSAQQRKNLKTFYELFEELTKEKHNIFGELQRVDSSSITLTQADFFSARRPDLQSIKQALRLLGWELSKLRLQKTHSRPSNTRPTQIVDDWGKWDSNHPFFHFYNSADEFKQALESLNENHQSVHRFRSNLQKFQHDFRNINRWTEAHFTTQKQQLQSLSSNVSVDIENHLASKLLEWIGQLED